MKLFSKPLLRWTEPREFARMTYEHFRKNRPWWALPGIWLALSGMLLCTAWLGHLKREIPDAASESMPPSFSAALVFVPIAAACLTAMVFMAARFDRCRFHITARGIGSDKHFFLFKQIAVAEWVDSRRFHVLKLSFNELPARLYGVPDMQTRIRIENLLRERGVQSNPLDATVESLLVGGSVAIYKFLIGLFGGMTIWCAGLGLSLMLIVSDLKMWKANAETLIGKYELLSQQLKEAGLPRENLKNTGRAENALMKESSQRLMRMHLISVGLWSALCFASGRFLMRSVAPKKHVQNTTSRHDEDIAAARS